MSMASCMLPSLLGHRLFERRSALDPTAGKSPFSRFVPCSQSSLEEEKDVAVTVGNAGTIAHAYADGSLIHDIPRQSTKKAG